jgi:hypothetical protein
MRFIGTTGITKKGKPDLRTRPQRKKYSIETKEGKSLKIYGEGVVDVKLIKEKIIHKLDEKKIDIPVLVCSYRSIGHVLWIPGKQVKGSKSCDWEISKDRTIRKIKNTKVSV